MDQKVDRFAGLEEKIQRLKESGQSMSPRCSHLDQIEKVIPSANGCEDCLKLGDRWVHLRMCLICGYVGCCDNSKNKHATKHFHTTQHPLIISLESFEEWIWCYADQQLITR